MGRVTIEKGEPWGAYVSDLSSWSKWETSEVKQLQRGEWGNFCLTPWDRLWEVKADCLGMGHRGFPGAGVHSGGNAQLWSISLEVRLLWRTERRPHANFKPSCHNFVSSTLSILTSSPLWAGFLLCRVGNPRLSGQFGDSLRWTMGSALEPVGHFPPGSHLEHSQLGTCWGWNPGFPLPHCVKLGKLPNLSVPPISHDPNDDVNKDRPHETVVRIFKVAPKNGLHRLFSFKSFLILSFWMLKYYRCAYAWVLISTISMYLGSYIWKKSPGRHNYIPHTWPWNTSNLLEHTQLTGLDRGLCSLLDGGLQHHTDFTLTTSSHRLLIFSKPLELRPLS